ncbi:MAG TPA: hypothetical protein VMR31_11700 [Myxococcota bacterium]|nr:hypothetical protein [Myxococcota bacterium]
MRLARPQRRAHLAQARAAVGVAHEEVGSRLERTRAQHDVALGAGQELRDALAQLGARAPALGQLGRARGVVAGLAAQLQPQAQRALQSREVPRPVEREQLAALRAAQAIALLSRSLRISSVRKP